jgi:hypothetical protein
VEDIEIRAIMKLDRYRSRKLVLGEIKGDEIRKPLTKLLRNGSRHTPIVLYSRWKLTLKIHLLKKAKFAALSHHRCAGT